MMRRRFLCEFSTLRIAVQVGVGTIHDPSKSGGSGDRKGEGALFAGTGLAAIAAATAAGGETRSQKAGE